MQEEYTKTVKTIIWVNEELCSFWSSANGWAPADASDLMSKSRLDRQVSLSKSLYNWSHLDNSKEGDLILAWANLGSLIEGTMKLFLSVFLQDYTYDEKKYLDKKDNIILPDILELEKLRQFFVKKDLFKDFHKFIYSVQCRKNAIHAYRDRDIGNFQDFKTQVDKYLSFLRDINITLPYPDEYYNLKF